MFLATVLLYFVAVFWSIQANEEWKKLELERIPLGVRPYVDFHPYLMSRQGGFMFVLGAVLGIAWLIAVLEFDHRTKKLGNRR